MNVFSQCHKNCYCSTERKHQVILTFYRAIVIHCFSCTSPVTAVLIPEF